MTVDKKVEELLAKEYRMDLWDCYNDCPNTDEWMLEQQIENSLIVVEVMLSEPTIVNNEDAYYFWDAVKIKLEKIRDENNN